VKEIIPRVQVELYEQAAHGESPPLFLPNTQFTDVYYSSKCHTC
jgi:hypothetical protein